jgi:flavin-dependent dehydrogenase
VEVYWGLGCEAYVTPVGPDLVDVALLGGAVGAGRFSERLQQFPRLAARLRGAAAVSEVRGAGPFGQRGRGVWRGNVALVGDASGCLDPITGEGVSLALHQARALVEALLAGDLRRYARAHSRQGRAPRRLNALVLAMGRRPRLRRHVVRTLSEEPRLFTRFLAAAGAGAPAMAGALVLMAWPLVRSVARR